MSKRRNYNKSFEYTCTITGESFRTTREAPHSNELVSVKAYYELHPDMDDRPEIVKMQIQFDEEAAKKLEEAEALAAELKNTMKK